LMQFDVKIPWNQLGKWGVFCNICNTFMTR
jgi:hypothetical protein